MPSPFHQTALLAALFLLSLASVSPAQPEAAPPTPPPPPPADDGFTTRDSTVGYIDSAIPWTQLRLRFDSAYGMNVPNRAEFFYAQPQPGGPGLPLPERNIDYQDLAAYGEMLLIDRLSVFAEVPVRFLNPEVNRNAAGLSDVNAGVKYAFIWANDYVATMQLRVYAPSGNVSQGLGTGHVSVEPALLGWWKLNDRWGLEGELRYWSPVGGTDFAGDIVRYGVGAYHNLYLGDELRIAPIVEFVGWTVLSGQEKFLLPSDVGVTQSAAGDTIVNAKAGVRFGYGPDTDMYVGYGRALTGDRWYQDILRLEFRRRF